MINRSTMNYRSLRDLQTDCIDVIQLHTWTRAWNRDPKPLVTLRKFQKEGKLRAIGISTPEHDQNSLVVGSEALVKETL